MAKVDLESSEILAMMEWLKGEIETSRNLADHAKESGHKILAAAIDKQTGKFAKLQSTLQYALKDAQREERNRPAEEQQG